MKIRIFLPLLILVLLALGLSSPNTFQTLSVDKMPVEFIFRSLQPGEVILAVMKAEPSAKAVQIHFLDRTYTINSSGPGAKPFALIGIDLDVKPQSYAVKISAEKEDGAKEEARQEFVIEPKNFPLRRFRVQEAMIAPPPQELERIQREQVILQDVYSTITPRWLGTGSFIAPLKQEAFPNFGQRRIYNRRPPSIHAGVDIGAPWGTKIMAANSGKIVLTSHLYFSGKTVIIDHGQGVFSVYGHLSKFLVKRGDLVKKGAPIGNVGNTGRSTGPHLHWSLRIFESRVDPLALVGLPLE